MDEGELHDDFDGKLRDLRGFAVQRILPFRKIVQAKPIKHINPNSSTAHTQSRVYKMKFLILDLYVFWTCMEPSC